MGNAVHQMLINLMPQAVITLFPCFRNSASRMINRHISLHGTLQKFIRLADSVRHLTLNHRSAVKTIHWHLRIRRYNDTIRFCNLRFCQHILCSPGASCLYLDLASQFFCLFLKAFCSHIRMRNSGRTSGNCQNFLS